MVSANRWTTVPPSNRAKPIASTGPPPIPSTASTLRRCWSPASAPSMPCCLRSEEHTSELQSLRHLVCRLLLEKKKHNIHALPTHATHTYSPQQYDSPRMY